MIRKPGNLPGVIDERPLEDRDGRFIGEMLSESQLPSVTGEAFIFVGSQYIFVLRS